MYNKIKKYIKDTIKIQQKTNQKNYIKFHLLYILLITH